MNYVRLGRSGYLVSRLCFGSLTLGPLCANLSPKQGADLLVQALEAGVNFIDTAEQYRNYQHLQLALANYPDSVQVIIATKTFAETDMEASWAIEDARVALRRDKLDIMLLHEIRNIDDFSARSGAWELLKKMKAIGVIGAIGLSTHSAEVVRWAADDDDIDIIHCMLNIDGIGILDGDRDSMLSAIRLAKKADKGVYSMKALAGGALMHSAKEALEWAFARSEVDSVAVGCRDAAELTTNICWLSGVNSPVEHDIEKIDRNIVFDKEPKCHGCGNCVRRCSTGAMTLGADKQALWDKKKCVYCGYCIAACPWFCLSFC